VRPRRHHRVFPSLSKRRTLSVVPIILPVDAAMMAITGTVFFRERASWPRINGIILAIVCLVLLRH
jgi:multidrug transporter EmrE-like cation transporter